MDNYCKLAIRYLKMNRRRSVITILGVVITTTLLVTFLNMAYLALIQSRNSYRESGDYEMVFFTETQEQAQELLADERIKSAYIGPYYYIDIHNRQNEQLYPNCLYVNVTHPYLMEQVFINLCIEYDLEGELNLNVAATYFQGSGKDVMVVAVLFILLVGYIMTIFGVGIVRNSIQLNALERIRDYGNLRCVGATKGQLKGIIYLQGAILELTGIAIGTVFGAGISQIVASMLKWNLGFQPLIILVILIFFMGDLYFTMGENSKLITGMSPVSAIRGEYRIKKEKLRVHNNRLVTKLLGVDGEYAYKSLMRSPKRFYRTVAAMAIGIVMVITWSGVWGSVMNFLNKLEADYGYYQLYFNNTLNVTETVGEVQASLPPVRLFEQVAQMPEVTESRRVYAADVWVADLEDNYAHYTDDYLEVNTNNVTVMDSYRETREQAETDPEITIGIWANTLMPKHCYGYDEAGIKRCGSTLTAGSLDISEHGIILVNPVETYRVEKENGYSYKEIATTDYQVGDTIDFVNMKRFREMLEPKLQEIQVQLEEKKEALLQEYKNGDEGELERETEYAEAEAERQKEEAAYQCWKELVEAGDYNTYTIEAIVSKNPNSRPLEQYYEEEITFILPMEQYYALTGTDESMSTGIQYHLERYKENAKLWDIWMEMTEIVDPSEGVNDIKCAWSSYLLEKDYETYMQQPLLIAVLILTFIIIMSALNFINATASNLHLRKKEFAQLQVVGASKKRIMKMTLLEGIITTIAADILGIGLGILLSAWLSYYMGQVMEIPYRFPYPVILLCIAGSFLLLVGSVYVPMRSLTKGLVEDLTSSGD